MPVYEFRCPKCQDRIEISKKMNDETSPLCCKIECGSIEMIQEISLTSFSLSGDGWARDGYSKTRVD